MSLASIRNACRRNRNQLNLPLAYMHLKCMDIMPYYMVYATVYTETETNTLPTFLYNIIIICSARFCVSDLYIKWVWLTVST